MGKCGIWKLSRHNGCWKQWKNWLYLFRLSTVGRAEKPRVIKVPACLKVRLRWEKKNTPCVVLSILSIEKNTLCCVKLYIRKNTVILHKLFPRLVHLDSNKKFMFDNCIWDKTWDPALFFSLHREFCLTLLCRNNLKSLDNCNISCIDWAEQGELLWKFQIEFKIKSRILIQKNIHSIEARIFNIPK